MEFAGMVDLARSPEDVKEDQAKMVAPSAEPTGPLYPYGMCLRMDDETLDKIGFEGDLPKSGEIVHIQALARVTSSGSNEQLTTNGERKVCRYVELQITHLAAEDEDREDTLEEREERGKAKTNAFYGDESGEGEE